MIKVILIVFTSLSFVSDLFIILKTKLYKAVFLKEMNFIIYINIILLIKRFNIKKVEKT